MRVLEVVLEDLRRVGGVLLLSSGTSGSAERRPVPALDACCSRAVASNATANCAERVVDVPVLASDEPADPPPPISIALCRMCARFS